MSEEKTRESKVVGTFSIKRDPQESDPALGPIIQAAAEDARRRVRARPVGQNRFQRRCVNDVWNEQRAILQAQGIDWKSPVQMNPGTMFDEKEAE